MGDLSFDFRLPEVRDGQPFRKDLASRGVRANYA